MPPKLNPPACGAGKEPKLNAGAVEPKEKPVVDGAAVSSCGRGKGFVGDKVGDLSASAGVL